MIEHLKWDSDFFGKKTGKVIANNENLNALIDEANLNKYDIVYIVYEGIKPENDLCESKGLYLSDIQISVSMNFGKKLNSIGYYELINDMNEQDYQDALEIVRSTASVSRFFNDKNFNSERIRDMYGHWLDNALNGSFSDGIFVERVNGRIGGVVIVKTDERARLTLMGVNPEMKRHGLGRKLLSQVLSYWADMEKEFGKIYSIFSLNNLESFRYHMRTEFTNIEDIKYIYHYIRK